MDKYDIGSLRHSCGMCSDFINEFVMCEDKEVVRKRAKHILGVTNVYMMSPAPGCEVTKDKYDMWFKFYEWIREKVRDICDNKDTERSLMNCCLEIEDMLKQLN